MNGFLRESGLKLSGGTITLPVPYDSIDNYEVMFSLKRDARWNDTTYPVWYKKINNISFSIDLPQLQQTTTAHWITESY